MQVMSLKSLKIQSNHSHIFCLLFSEEKINVIFMVVKNAILHFLPELSVHCMLLKYKKLPLFIPWDLVETFPQYLKLLLHQDIMYF